MKKNEIEKMVFLPVVADMNAHQNRVIKVLISKVNELITEVNNLKSKQNE